jgi:hypothetical protein
MTFFFPSLPGMLFPVVLYSHLDVRLTRERSYSSGLRETGRIGIPEEKENASGRKATRPCKISQATWKTFY